MSLLARPIRSLCCSLTDPLLTYPTFLVCCLSLPVEAVGGLFIGGSKRVAYGLFSGSGVLVCSNAILQNC